ncbi:sugar phosphate isomerase/epimerase [Pseudolysinimonas sp.]|uniref:sugar phosphate isomerase/epimerase family protein n=1 Tax=Pseudolysinimonas sp. TaxID=2680009 RepID=UPI00286C9150|nr:sugar phosphate isomerase/epimerase [Pseudolysinimonas sp.]
MSTSCNILLGVEQSFRLARIAGYDGLEIMVTTDPVSRDAAALNALIERYSLPILSIHAPSLFWMQLIGGRDAQVKLEKSAELAASVGASSVVVHPPFRWEAGYAKNFERIVRQTAQNTGIEICVENMFPWKVGHKILKAYAPSPDPLDLDVDAMTLDFSHASLSGRDSLEYAMAMGDKLRHIHLCDGRRSVDDGNMHDEHLVPGRGTQPVAETLTYLVENGFTGHVVAEIGLHKIRNPQVRLDMLVETVAFAKQYIGQEHATREPLARGAERINGRSVRRARKAASRS